MTSSSSLQTISLAVIISSVPNVSLLKKTLTLENIIASGFQLGRLPPHTLLTKMPWSRPLWKLVTGFTLPIRFLPREVLARILEQTTASIQGGYRQMAYCELNVFRGGRYASPVWDLIFPSSGIVDVREKGKEDADQRLCWYRGTTAQWKFFSYCQLNQDHQSIMKCVFLTLHGKFCHPQCHNPYVAIISLAVVFMTGS